MLTHDPRMDLRLTTLEGGSAEWQSLVQILESEAQVRVLARCQRTGQALKSIRNERPDLLFIDLDAQLGTSAGKRLSVPRFLRMLQFEQLPLMVLVTQSRDYASQAFEADAAAYLVRPIDAIHLRKVLGRMRARIMGIRALALHQELVDRPAADTAPIAVTALPAAFERVTVVRDGNIRFVATADIHSIVSCRNNIVLHTARDAFVFRSTLQRAEQQLAGQSFLRIERSVLVNLRYVQEVQRAARRRFEFRLASGQVHFSCASYHEAVLAYLKQCQLLAPVGRGLRTSASAARRRPPDRQPWTRTTDDGR